MLWRLKGTMVFTTNATRNAFVTSYNSFLVGKVVLINNSVAFGPPPSFLVDVAFELESNALLLHDNIRNVSINGLVRAMIGRHKCRVQAGELPPDPPFHTETFYWSFP
jgi:hypothetical protein